MQIEDLYKIYQKYQSVTTDTRKIVPNSIFFALKGDNFNGNEFADQAVQSGASYAVIDDKQFKKSDKHILVDDVLATLQALAAYHRQQLHIPVIGITGTNGKTTTKELLYAVLSQYYRTFATQGNLNNHIGVPLSILAIDDTYHIAVIEMGANHIGEIAHLSSICQPTHGLITNVGRAHLEGFGSFEGVKIAKGELYDYISDNNGTLFLQGDNSDLAEMVDQRKITKIIRYGSGLKNDIIGSLLSANPYITISWQESDKKEEHVVQTNLTGSYNLENFLAAITVGVYFDVRTAKIIRGINNYIPDNNRSQVIKTNRNTVVADFYNANASSMAAALDNMKVLKAKHKTIILGDMFEMGEDSYEEHKNILEIALSLQFNKLIFVGKEFYKHKSRAAEFYQTTDEAKEAVKSLNNSYILLKASRGMAFEHILLNL